MSKEAFLTELAGHLKVLEEREQQDILDEYAQHIDMKIQNGMSEEELASVRKRLRDEQPPMEEHHIALNNIFRRLKIVYGDHSHMVIRSKQGFYTSVEICIPLDGEPDAAGRFG